MKHLNLLKITALSLALASASSNSFAAVLTSSGATVGNASATVTGALSIRETTALSFGSFSTTSASNIASKVDGKFTINNSQTTAQTIASISLKDTITGLADSVTLSDVNAPNNPTMKASLIQQGATITSIASGDSFLVVSGQIATMDYANVKPGSFTGTYNVAINY